MLLENTWWKCSLFSFPKRCQTTNASYSRMMKSRMENCSKSLQYGVFPSGHLVVLSQVFLMKLHSLTSLVTPVALLFCKCWRYSSVSVEDSQIFRTCQRKACWYKAYAPATEKHVARYQDQEMSCFSYLRCSKTPSFGHENCSEELFPTIVFRFVRQSRLHELQKFIHGIFHFDFEFTWFASHETSHVSMASHVNSFSVWLIQKLNLWNPHNQGNVLNISERTYLRSRLKDILVFVSRDLRIIVCALNFGLRTFKGLLRNWLYN